MKRLRAFITHRLGPFLFFSITVGLITVIAAVPARADNPPPPAQPFEQAIILAGGGMGWAVNLGIYDGALASGRKPDLVIGVCGGAIAAATTHVFGEIFEQPIHSIPRISNHAQGETPSLRPEIRSSLFEWLRDISLQEDNIASLYGIYRSVKRSLKRKQFPEIVLTRHLFKVPYQSQDSTFRVPFSRSPRGERLVILATRLLNQQEQHERRQDTGRVIRLRQVIFTDPETADHFQSWQLTTAKLLPHTYMDHIVEVRSDFTIEEAIRASISDPMLMEPFQKDGQIFFSGAADNYPIDLARHVASRVIESFRGSLPRYQDRVFRATFGHSINEILDSVETQNRMEWINLAGPDEDHFAEQFNPKLHWVFWIRDRFPKSEHELETGIQKSYQFARVRAIRALRRKDNARIMKQLLSSLGSKGTTDSHHNKSWSLDPPPLY